MNLQPPDRTLSHPRLVKVAVITLLCATLALSAYLGLQVHGPAATGSGVLLEWMAFLASLAACLGVLWMGSRVLGGRTPSSANTPEDGTDDQGQA